MSFLSQNLPVNILEPRKQHEPAGNCSEIADFSSEYYISFISGVAKSKVWGSTLLYPVSRYLGAETGYRVGTPHRRL